MELANIINSKMYGGEIQHRERHAMIYGREVARNLIETLFCHYELIDEQNQTVDATSCLVQPYLAQQAKCLVVYKIEAARQGVRSDNDRCTDAAVLVAFQRYCIQNAAFLQIFNSCTSFESFAWAGATWNVRRRNKPSIPHCKRKYIYLNCIIQRCFVDKNGHTYEDRVWLKMDIGHPQELPELVLPHQGDRNTKISNGLDQPRKLSMIITKT